MSTLVLPGTLMVVCCTVIQAPTSRAGVESGWIVNEPDSLSNASAA
jgi:hypothetical protein